jgi:hypothetical protein
MSFREKSAWITLISVLLCFATLAVGWIARSNMPVRYVLLSVGALVVLQPVLHAVIALVNLREARAPRDEREQMIANRSRTIGYYVLMIWMIGIVVAVHSPQIRTFEVLLIASLGIVIASAIVALTQIIQFRRGA